MNLKLLTLFDCAADTDITRLEKFFMKSIDEHHDVPKMFQSFFTPKEIKNPDRMWFQFWKPKMVPNPHYVNMFKGMEDQTIEIDIVRGKK